MPSLIQLLIMITGFVVVFVLPELDVNFASYYFSAVAIVNLALIFGAPLGAIIQRDIVKGQDYDKYLVTIVFNILMAGLIISEIDDNITTFIILASLLIGLVYYFKGVLIAQNKIKISYFYNLIRGLTLPLGALASVNFVKNFEIFNSFLLIAIILMISVNWKELRRCNFPDLQEYLSITKSTLYLAGSNILIWLFFQLPRINFFQLNSTEMVVLIQSMSVPLALLSIFEARGPYLLNKVLLGKSKPVLYSVFILILFYGSSFIFFNIALIFLRNYGHPIYINSEIAAVFFVLSFVLSFHFDLVRRLLALTSEEKIFKLFIPSISFYGIFAFILLSYMENFSYWLLVLIFLVLYVPSMIFAYKKFPCLGKQ